MLPQHWFDRIERRLHWLSIPGLASFLVGMNAMVWVMSLLRPAFPSLLVLDPWALRHGQWWRAVTFLFVPPASGPIWTIFWLMLLYTFAAALENEWGDVRFNLYYGLGVIATVAASWAFENGIGFHAPSGSREVVVQTASSFFISRPGNGFSVAGAVSLPSLSFGAGGPQMIGQKVKVTMRPWASSLVGSTAP